MAIYTYDGTNAADTIDTGELKRSMPDAYGFTINGLGGNDTIYLSFIGRSGYDIADGGTGDDFMSVFTSYYSPGTETNVAVFFGDYGYDRVYIPDGYVFISNFSVVDKMINATITSETGELTDIKIYSDIEVITLGGNGNSYLTEDIVNGRIRAVDFSEQFSRTTGANSDWFLRGLDTYTTYHSPTSSSNTQKGKIIKGTEEKDKLKGTNGNDTIIGKGGADKILGKGGDDIIDSGEWNKGDKMDKIEGGSGADTFIINDDYWCYIKDFNVFEDKLDVSGLSGGLDWDIQGNKTYIWGVDGDEVARIAGAIDLSQANII